MTDEFPSVLDALLDRRSLDAAGAEALMGRALDGSLGPERLAALVTALRAKGPHADELVGFARTLRNHAHRIHPPEDGAGGVVLDNCGTGGSPHKTVNVSTAAAFVLAAGGLTVAKHGNRSVTRPSGSADVLERAGARFDLAPHAVECVLRSAGIAFLFAPTFHPAMRHAVPVRRALGIKTVFNLLGPLTNPAGATHQVLGVYHPDLVPLMAEVLARLGCQGGIVLHGHTADGAPGFDEATPCGPVSYARVQDGAAGPVERFDPDELGLERRNPDELVPVPAERAAGLLRSILAGTAPEPILDTVALNAALGFLAAGRVPDLAAGLAQARAILAAGDGNAKLDAYLAATQPP